MKPDGVSMDKTEPTEAAAPAESSVSQENAVERASTQSGQTENDVSPDNAPKTNGKPDPQVIIEASPSKKQAATKTQDYPKAKPQPHAVSTHRPLNNNQSSTNNKNSGNKMAAKPPLAKPDTKRPVTVATVAPFSKFQTQVGELRPVGSGASRTTSSASVTARNVSTTTGRPVTSTGMNPSTSVAARVDSGAIPKTGKSSTSTAARMDSGAIPKTGKSSTSTAARVDNGAIPKTGKSSTTTAARVDSGAIPKTGKSSTTVAARVDSGVIPKTWKHGTTTAARVDSGALPKNKRPTTASSASSGSRPGKTVASSSAKAVSSGSRSAPSTSRAGNHCASKPPSIASGKTAAAGVTTVPSTGRNTATLSVSAAAKTDVSRPPSAAVSKRSAAPSVATKPPATGKPTSALKWHGNFQKVNPTGSQTKSKEPAKSGPAKSSSAASLKPPGAGKSPLRRTQSASPAKKTTNGNLAKFGTKPTQAILPTIAVVEKTKASNCKPSVKKQRDAGATLVVEVAKPPEMVAQESASATLVPAVGLPQTSTRDSPPEEVPQATAQTDLAAPAPSYSPEIPPPVEHSKNDAASAQPDQVSATVMLPTPKLSSLPEISSQSVDVSSDQTLFPKAIPTAAKSVTQVIPLSNLNDEEDEDEREGSQLVSVSEMSGTTQATEESRPGSAGPAAGSTWRAGGAFLSELDSFSGSQQGASELSAPGVLEGTESMDDLGEGSLKGAMDMEGASAGSPDFEKVPDIPVNDYEEDDDDEDRVCDMDMGSEKTDELLRQRHDNAVDDDDDEDVEMASEGVTESGLESYGNADEDDFAEDERLDNLNRLAQLPPSPQLPSALGAQWDRPNPFAESLEEKVQLQTLPEPVAEFGQVEAAVSLLVDPMQADSETTLQSPAQAWLEISHDPHVQENQGLPLPSTHEAQMGPDHCVVAPQQTPDQTLFPISTMSSESVTPEGLCNSTQEGTPQIQQVLVTSPQPDAGVHMAGDNQEVKALTMPADELLRGVVNALTSNPSSSSVTEDEASDTEGEALLDDSLETTMVQKQNTTCDVQAPTQRCLSTVEEVEELETTGLTDDATPPSVTSLTSYGFDSATTASNAQSTGEGCIKSPGIFSLEELPEESKELQDPAQAGLAEQQYIDCGKLKVDSTEEARGSEVAQTLDALQPPSDKPEDIHPAYYSAVCEKTDISFAGLTTLPHRRRHGDPQATTPRLTCADLPPRKSGQQALSPQLRRLEQHQRQLMEMQQRREQQSRPLEGAEQERKRTEEEEQKRKKDEAEEEIKRNEREVGEEDKMVIEGAITSNGEDKMDVRAHKVEGKTVNGEGKIVAVEMSTEEELKRHELELQLQQQQAELKQRQQIMQWQQELEEQKQTSPGRTMVPSPSSGLCTIYEALENSDEELDCRDRDPCERRLKSDLKDPNKNPSNGDHSSPERPAPLDLDWSAKVDMVQQLINQTLLLNGDGCSSLLLLPGGAGGTLSPLESSLWPNLLPPISPPSATVTSVSSFSPEAAGSSPQGEWTVVELETHH
ncbi:uncharacterized protein LOC130920186 isoform X2 [Corythoichthys intestinalis]|uniref:uncharacterized protein LOC130920186 isoform X2 n=1 Tax=Corythoichthys intestinalis TaxID=161448 RepID=UPI0025A645D5|nr:uncharacterized protein LOC130920186 isoform X2 [Corythoichthys intestinalis]